MYIIIIGCGRLGSSLARQLSIEGHDIAIIDNNKENLDRLGSGFNGERIKGVEFDNDVLISAGIKSADVFLAMTSDDNVNAMAAQVAKNIFNVKRVIARIFDIEREFIYRKLGLETISPTELGVDIIKSRILETGSDIIASLDENLSIVELPVCKNKLDTVELTEKRYNCIISCILRNGKFMIPKKSEKISEGDKIICTINANDRDKLFNKVNGGIIK